MSHRRAVDPAFDTLIFLHLPKTAGTTLRSIIRSQYADDEVCELYRYPSREAVERFGRLPREERDGYRVILGHMQIGVHRFVSGPHVYVTLLRHPVDRCISAYRFVRRKANHPRHDLIRGKDIREVLEEGLLPFFDNGQTRALCSSDVAAVPYGGCTREMLDEARENLERHVELAGTIEGFDVLLLFLQDRLGWSSVWYRRKNRSPRESGRAASRVSGEVAGRIAEFNHLDLELYDFVKRRLARRVERAGPEFQRRVRRFKRINRMRSMLVREGG